MDNTIKLMQTNVNIKFFKNVQLFLKRTILITVLLVLWEIAPKLEWVDASFFPPLSVVIEAWIKLLISGQLIDHITASLVRAFSGFTIAILIGIPTGLFIGWYKGFSDIVNPIIEVFRNIPALALFPLFILFLGIGETSKITIVVYACSWPIILNTISAVKNVDSLLVLSAQSIGVKEITLFRKVILPAAVPTIFTGVRLAGATSILVLVAAEMIGAKAGLGYLIQYAQYSFEIPNMYAGIITIAPLGLLVNKGLLTLEAKFSSWKPKNND